MGSPNPKQIMIKAIEDCLLPKLSTNYEDRESHPEFAVYKSGFPEKFQALTKILGQDVMKVNLKGSSRVMAWLLILYKDMQTSGPWKDAVVTQAAGKLNAYFELIYGIQFDDLLKGGHRFDEETVFYKCMEELHRKLTPQNFKKYPSLIEVYRLIIKQLNDYNVHVRPMKVMPISLLLIEDYVPNNKIWGLQSCSIILDHLKKDTFNGGNYYEVILSTLLKSYQERSAEVTNTVIDCFLKLINLLPENVKESKTDEIYAMTLEQVLTESNIYRKALLYRFTTKLIKMLRANCVKRRVFIDAIVDGVTMCCNHEVQDLLIGDVLECLEEWIKFTWPAWNLQTDFMVLSEMMKLQCAAKPANSKNVIKIIATLITNCTEDEQLNIVTCLEQNPRQLESYTDRVGEVRNAIAPM